MKKLLLIGLGFVLAVAVLGLAGFAYAQTQDPPEPVSTIAPEFSYGRAGGSRGTHGGRLGGLGNAFPGEMIGFGLDEDPTGLLHDYLWPAIAEAFKLTDEQIEAFELVRKTVLGIRADLTPDEIRGTRHAAMTAAVERALADEVISEERAESWLESLEQNENLAPSLPFGRGGRIGDFRRGFSSGVRFSRQVMLNHEYLDAAIADLLDISVDELQNMRSEDGFNWKTYVDELGLSDQESADLLKEVFSNAIQMALEDGAITQQQADWILDRLENGDDRGGWFIMP